MFIKKVTIGRDAELRFTAGDKPMAVANVSLAYNYGKKDKQGNYPTQWIEASIWGKRAESSSQYLVKGAQIVAVVKDLHIETYPKKDGTEGFKLAGTLDDFEFCGGKKEASPVKPEVKSKVGGFEDMDSDIPF